MKDGFIKVASATPQQRVADCSYNAEQIIQVASWMQEQKVKLLLTPELGITGYTCGDLFLQRTLRQSALSALHHICTATSHFDMLLVVGLPLLDKDKLYNVAAILYHGKVLGFVPKTHLPNYGEFYEMRQFTPAFKGEDIYQSTLLGEIPFSTHLLFQCKDMPEFTLGIELCEDLWAPAPPSIQLSSAGATIIGNLSASNETVGKAEYRRNLVTNQSARLLCGYVYADAGSGESTTDMVFASHNMIAENGTLLAETPLFKDAIAISEIDVQRLQQERLRMNTFSTKASTDSFNVIPFSMPIEECALTRIISASPFVATDAAAVNERCETIFSIQAAGLKKRLEHIHADTAVIGISGGLDSALALLVVARAFSQMNKPMQNILAVTMPAFGTTQRTRNNAEKLCEALGVTLQTVDISDTVRSHFNDINQDEQTHDVTYENAQARIRTLVLMDMANQKNGLVIGTGDLSELALGWATYNGDHMSMYGVNASIPKTLVRHMVAYEASAKPALHEVLSDILATPVSPELLPAKDGVISQQTEELVGPYELHDFTLYYVLRWGFSPCKIYRLAQLAFANQYDAATILHWLKVFYKRFFSQQFKRNCMPDGPKVGSVSLSPRGDWRMPSDAISSAWIDELSYL